MMKTGTRIECTNSTCNETHTFITVNNTHAIPNSQVLSPLFFQCYNIYITVILLYVSFLKLMNTINKRNNYVIYLIITSQWQENETKKDKSQSPVKIKLQTTYALKAIRLQHCYPEPVFQANLGVCVQGKLCCHRHAGSLASNICYIEGSFSFSNS